jgi:hypothetical protein
MKILLNIIFLFSLSLGLYGQVSINITYMVDTITAEPESIEDALVSNNAFKDDDLLVFPLKTSAVINIVRTSEQKKAYTGLIMDESGKVIKTVVLDAINNQINLNKLSYGLYVLKIEPENTPVAEVDETKQDSEGKGQ